MKCDIVFGVFVILFAALGVNGQNCVLHADPNDCAHYITYNSGTSTQHKCKDGQLFDGNLKTCVSANIAKCHIKIQDTCFGAKDDQFGNVSFTKSGAVESLILKHKSGFITCDVKIKSYESFWGCGFRDDKVNTWITDNANNRIFPKNLSGLGFYMLQGYHHKRSPEIRLSFSRPIYWRKSEEIRVWFGEDLLNTSEGDNGGQHCIEVWAQYAHPCQLQ